MDVALLGFSNTAANPADGTLAEMQRSMSALGGRPRNTVRCANISRLPAAHRRCHRRQSL